MSAQCAVYLPVMKSEKESRFDSATDQGKLVAWLKLRYCGMELTIVKSVERVELQETPSKTNSRYSENIFGPEYT